MFGTFLLKFEKYISRKNRVPSLFRIYSPLTSCKKSEKTNVPILRKTFHGRTNERINTAETIRHIG